MMAGLSDCDAERDHRPESGLDCNRFFCFFCTTGPDSCRSLSSGSAGFAYDNTKAPGRWGMIKADGCGLHLDAYPHSLQRKKRKHGSLQSPLTPTGGCPHPESRCARRHT